MLIFIDFVWWGSCIWYIYRVTDWTSPRCCRNFVNLWLLLFRSARTSRTTFNWFACPPSHFPSPPPSVQSPLSAWCPSPVTPVVVVVVDHPEGPASCKWSSRGASLWQMIIRRCRPLANDHPEGPASCIWSYVTLVTSACIQIQSRGPFYSTISSCCMLWTIFNNFRLQKN